MSMLPGPGPQWFGAVMGTGILANLSQTVLTDVPGHGAAALGLLAVGWTVLLVLVVGFGARVARTPTMLRDTVRDLRVLPTWGMVAMGVLSVGSATQVVLPARWSGAAGAAYHVDAVMWTVGTVLGVVTALDFARRLIGTDAGEPALAWGLPVVPPMVSATAATAIAARLSDSGRTYLLIVTIALFLLALSLGMVVFAVGYNHHLRVAPLPIDASTAAWIPLGIVGQSTAAAQGISVQARPLVTGVPADAVQHAANVYGVCMLLAGVPLVAWAAGMTVRGFRRRMRFSPGWWSLTFPIGTLCLGSHQLAAGTGSAFLIDVSVLLCLVLVGTWSLCATATARALIAVGRTATAPRGRGTAGSTSAAG